MQMLMEWWVWIVLGFALIVLEMFTATFFVLWFGMAAVLVGLLIWYEPALLIQSQLLVWAALSSLLAVLWFKVFKKDRKSVV